MRRPQRKTPEYTAWDNMKRRCLNPQHPEYRLYGGRGITVCDRWLKFEPFLEDVGKRPSPTHSLDRFPDNNGNYEPGNIRWATPIEQHSNQRSNRKVAWDGEQVTISELARRTGVNYKTLSDRLVRGFTPIEAVTEPLNEIRRASSLSRTCFMTKIVATLVLAIALCGCAKTTTVTHPGAVNQFDSSVYDSLRAAQAAIEQARTQVGDNAILKAAVNKAIASYNTAEDAYVAYHKAAVAGTVPDTATLSQLLATLVGDVQAIKGAK